MVGIDLGSLVKEEDELVSAVNTPTGPMQQ